MSLAEVIESRRVSGAVALVVDRHGATVSGAAGLADVAAGRPMTIDSVFWVASMTKPITATAVLLAAADAIVDLDEDIRSYLPDFDPPVLGPIGTAGPFALRPVQRPITLRLLLSHRSGLPFSSPVEFPSLDSAPILAHTQAYALSPLIADPGDRFEYSNAGFNVAARAIEVTSGMPFDRFLQERIFDPLGMTETTFWPSADQEGRRALCYQPSTTELIEVPIPRLSYPLGDRARHPFAGGGLFSTAADMGRFGRFILNEGDHDGEALLSATAVQEMHRGQPDPADTYGLGWALVSDGTFMHLGACGTELRIDPAHGLASVWMIQLVAPVVLDDDDKALLAVGAPTAVEGALA